MKYQSSSYKVGMALRPSHYSYLENRPATEVAWFEAATERYLSPGRAVETLQLIRQDYPLALHGVGMNLGNPDGVRLEYLNKLHDLNEQVEPFIISDHIAWTGTSNHHLHELLPLPFAEDTLQILASNIDQAQSQLKTTLALENISTLVRFKHDEMTEWEFISELTRRTGCSLLLDLNAVLNNAYCHGFDPVTYLKNIPLERVAQIHLSESGENAGEISHHVWELFKTLAPRIRHLPIAIERESHGLRFSDAEMDVIKASFILENSHETKRSAELV